MNRREKSFEIKKLVGMAVFAALAYGVTFVFRIPVSFLTFDAKDAVLAIAAFIYGPLAGIIMAFIPAFIELVTISGTGFYGFLMNFISSAAFAFTASIIYKYFRTLNGAVMGIFISIAATTALMMPLNILITPLYTGASVSAVIDMIPTLLLPFNFAKSLMNGAFTMLLYKPVSVAMKRAGLIKGNISLKFTRSSVIMLTAGLVSLVASVVIFIILKT